MWMVLKYKKKEFNFLKRGFTKVLGDLPLIFQPKIKYQKIIKNKLHFLENDILDDYIICYHKKFGNSETINSLKNLKGLKYFLNGSRNQQREIINFISYCKKNLGSDGYIKQSFFEISKMTKGIFVNGPFANMIFSVIKNQREKLQILIGNVRTTISKKTDYFYRPV